MKLDYQINLVGHGAWLESGYSQELALGDVVTRDGEILGLWRVVEYNPEHELSGGSYEFIADGHEIATLRESFPFLDHRYDRGLAMTKIVSAIQAWHEDR